MLCFSGDNFLAPTYKLENDPMCGTTTGGQRQCFWDCEFWSDPYFGTLISNPECLEDCYPEVMFLAIKSYHIVVCEADLYILMLFVSQFVTLVQNLTY